MRFKSLYERTFPASFHLLLFLTLSAVMQILMIWLPHAPGDGHWQAFPDLPWIDGWIRWDAGWYRSIADHGYHFKAIGYSSVAFFPGFPIAMALTKPVFGDAYLAGLFVSFMSGLGLSILFLRWARLFVSEACARRGLYLLYLSPFGFYVVAAVYSEPLFVLLCVAAFLAVEKDRLLLAGMLGGYASFTRHIGVAVCLGLFIRTLERHGVFGKDTRFFPKSLLLRHLRRSSFLPLISLSGIGLFCTYLWVRFGHPFLFAVAVKRGWNFKFQPEDWLKIKFFRTFGASFEQLTWMDWNRVVHALVAILAIGCCYRVGKKFGFGYFIFCLAVLAIPLAKSPDFYEMGRYLLPAFPCFLGAATALEKHPRIFWLWIIPSFLYEVWALSLYSRWWFVS